MSQSPNIYLDDPDPLSLLLKRLELRAEVYVNGAFCGSWAVDTAGSKRIPFHLIGAGEAWLHFGKNKPRQLGQWDLVVFPHDAHHIIADSASRPAEAQVNAPMSNEGEITQLVCGFFEFKNPAIFPVLQALPDIVCINGKSEAGSHRIGRFIELMLLELNQALPGSYAAIDQFAFLLFLETLRQQVDLGALSEGLLAALFDSRIGLALNAIHKNPEQTWTLETLAERAAMSRSSFADRFSRLVGETPMKYLTAWRMTEARRLLASTAMSTVQVAQLSGYESEASFRKAFKSVLGQTPGEVRAASR